MARKRRVEVEGGLYHVITRGNDRQDVVHSHDDHLKFLSLLAKQKERSPFYLYADCQMTNHVHLLIERRKSINNLHFPGRSCHFFERISLFSDGSAIYLDGSLIYLYKSPAD